MAQFYELYDRIVPVGEQREEECAPASLEEDVEGLLAGLRGNEEERDNVENVEDVDQLTVHGGLMGSPSATATTAAAEDASLLEKRATTEHNSVEEELKELMQDVKRVRRGIDEVEE